MFNTAESVTPKHPDKICDRISDAVLDECLRKDPDSRVAVETTGGHGIISVTGEVTTKGYVDVRKIVKRIVGNKYGIQINLERQSPDIAKGVDEGGAGDQGIMIGYACNENEEMIPQEMFLAKDLCKYLYYKFMEDGKTQITINNAKEIVAVVCSFNNILTSELKKWIDSWLLYKMKADNVRVFVNPAGDWSVGSLDADTGLTGRKIVVDAYGPRVPVGGGAFSGKDPSKVDRSAAYMARKYAVELMKKTDSTEIKVSVAYGIGLVKPIIVEVIMDGMIIDVDDIERFEPNNIIKELDLKKPIYEKTAEWGAFGNAEFNWNK